MKQKYKTLEDGIVNNIPAVRFIIDELEDILTVRVDPDLDIEVYERVVYYKRMNRVAGRTSDALPML